VLKDVNEELASKGIKASIELPRGKVLELADQVQILQSSDKWENKLFRDPPDSKEKLGDEAWKRLKNEAVEYWANLEPYRKEMNELDSQPNRLKALAAFILLKNNSSGNPEDATSEKVVDAWIKKQAWNELLVRVEDKWKSLGLKDHDAEFKQ